MPHKIVQSQQTVQEKMTEARTNLAEKVSVAGIKEALQEEVPWIRRTYQLAMFAFACCIIWKTYQIIIDWLGGGNTTEVSDAANQEFLPVSNVTICAQVFFNETFIRENIVIPEKVADQYVKQTGNSLDEFFSQLTLFLSITMRTRAFNPTMLAYFSKVIRANPQIKNYSAFTSAALPRCESMLKTCSFNGVQFDCCDRAVQSVDDDGVCYLLALNFDSDNAVPSIRTVHQTNPGPRGGLTIEASMSSKDFPWMDDILDNGYLIYVNAVPYSAMQSPLGAPHAAETFVKVTAAKRVWSTNCAPQNKLTVKGALFMYYDPEGYDCSYREIVTVVKKYLSCHMPLFLYRPNNSIVCHPATTYFATSMFASSNMVEMHNSFLSNSTGHGALTNLDELEHDLGKAFSGRAFCPKHCHYWTYSSTASFFYLEKKYTKSTIDRETTFSKIHVYYADLGYRRYQEAKTAASNSYLSFYSFSNVAMLYLGMSMVSFFDLLIHLGAYFYAWRQLRKRPNSSLKVKRKLIRTIKVHPQAQPNSETSI